MLLYGLITDRLAAAILAGESTDPVVLTMIVTCWVSAVAALLGTEGEKLILSRTGLGSVFLNLALIFVVEGFSMFLNKRTYSKVYSRVGSVPPFTV